MKAQEERGQIVIQSRRDDILAKALKKAERGGRVRAVGSGITNKEYFGFKKPTTPTQYLAIIDKLCLQMNQYENNQNIMMSLILSGQNSDQMKQQLMAFGGPPGGIFSSQSSSFGGQGSPDAQSASSNFGHGNGFFTQLLTGDVGLVGQGVISTKRFPEMYSEVQCKEKEPEPYYVPWPEPSKEHTIEHQQQQLHSQNSRLPWPDDYDTLPISDLPEVINLT